MQQFDPYTVSFCDPDKEATPAERCLAELVMHARQYRGCDWSAHGDRRAPGWAASEYLGKQADGRPAWRFGSEHDAQDFIDDALRIAASHKIEADATYHPDVNGMTTALVRLDFADCERCHENPKAPGAVWCFQCQDESTHELELSREVVRGGEE